jgi:spoIIIJ-associated protein
VEWVETTGRTIEEAKELALDQLGVDNGDAEFEVVEEPKVGLFGRTRGVARVRARILPRTPRPKVERRRRQKKSDTPRGDDRPRQTSGGAKESAEDRRSNRNDRAEGDSTDRAKESGDDRSGTTTPGRERPSRERESMDMDEQTDVIRTFLQGLVKSFDLEAEVAVSVEDEELVANLTGDGLGLLVGQRLATLDSIQEIARNALQRHAEGREYAKVVVDVQGVRQRRRSALADFVNDAAQQVRDEDVTVVFDVMSSADRKVVHDVASDLDGVVSASEGEDPRRRVVLRKA